MCHHLVKACNDGEALSLVEARHLDCFVPRNDAKRAWVRSPDKYVSASLRVGQPLRFARGGFAHTMTREACVGAMPRVEIPFGKCFAFDGVNGVMINNVNRGGK